MRHLPAGPTVLHVPARWVGDMDLSVSACRLFGLVSGTPWLPVGTRPACKLCLRRVQREIDWLIALTSEATR